MDNQDSDRLYRFAEEYFSFLAKTFPVMCASDEFDTFPRAQAARHYYHKLDAMDCQNIQESIAILEDLGKKLKATPFIGSDLKSRADRALLATSIRSVLITLRDKASWRHNPLLYLKIGAIGLDHALTRPAREKKERLWRFGHRLRALPRLLRQAVENLNAVPGVYHSAALSMAKDFQLYLHETIHHLPSDDGHRNACFSPREKEDAFDSLQAFENFLASSTPVPDDAFSESIGLESVVRERYHCTKSLEEIWSIARQEWRTNLEALQKWQKNIAPNTSWKDIYHDYMPSDLSHRSVMWRYEEEIDALSDFFKRHGFESILRKAWLIFKKTPTYLRSVRGTASFSAALSRGENEPDFFYISPQDGKTGEKDASVQKEKRLHREYRFLSAHETVPGHQLLDTARRGLKNPVRRQIESPLFYEGWATYAETLLKEYGYMDSPMENLIACKRRLWRSARCQIDVGLNTGHLTKGNAIKLLTEAGFSKKEARNQIHRYHLNPGYQLCYTLGLHEFITLRDRYGTRWGLRPFHEHVLEAGELPFPFLEKYLEEKDQGTAPKQVRRKD